MKFRKGELEFYKSSLPKELRKYSKQHPENKDFVDEFLKKYAYNYVSKKWAKRDHKTDAPKRIGDVS